MHNYKQQLKIARDHELRFTFKKININFTFSTCKT